MAEICSLSLVTIPVAQHSNSETHSVHSRTLNLGNLMNSSATL